MKNWFINNTPMCPETFYAQDLLIKLKVLWYGTSKTGGDV